MSWLHWLLLPPVAAAIGWFTNFIAVRMIFRPHRPVSILGLKLQGLLPKRRREFAESIGQTVEDHLFSSDDIKKILEEPAVKEKLTAKVRERIDDFLEKKVIGANPMLGAFLKGSFIDGLKVTLVTEVGALIADGAKMLGSELDEHLDMKGLVEEKILSFDMMKLEAIVLNVAKKELVAIEVLGAVLGFAVGLLQLLVLWLTA